MAENYSYSGDDIYYIPNGVYINNKNTKNKNEFVLENTINYLKKVKKKGKFIVLYSGSLVLTNKLETIIDAAEYLKNNKQLKIILIGRGQKEVRYKEQIKNKGLHNIQILPPVKKMSVAEMLRQVDVLVLIQGDVQWGSSNKLYDYMASGLPIISSVHVSHNDIVAEIGGGISVEPENPSALAEAILTLFKKSYQDRQQIGRRNVSYIKKYHDWDILSQKLIKLVEKVYEKFRGKNE